MKEEDIAEVVVVFIAFLVFVISFSVTAGIVSLIEAL
jgi:hypothetical protein